MATVPMARVTFPHRSQQNSCFPGKDRKPGFFPPIRRQAKRSNPIITLSQNGYGAYGKNYFSTSIAAEVFLSRQRSKTWIFPDDRKFRGKKDNKKKAETLRLTQTTFFSRIFEKNLRFDFGSLIGDSDLRKQIVQNRLP